MLRKTIEKTFALNAVIDGHLVAGFVSFSPAPEPGVLTEVARLDAERIFAEAVRADLSSEAL
jgi:hypothetical protein